MIIRSDHNFEQSPSDASMVIHLCWSEPFVEPLVPLLEQAERTETKEYRNTTETLVRVWDMVPHLWTHPAFSSVPVPLTIHSFCPE